MHAKPVVSLLLLSGALAQAPSPPQPLPAESAARLLRRVDDHYNHLRSLETHFTEHYQGIGTSRTESGTLLLKKPGRMIWRYNQPAGKVFVFDGKYAYFYTPGDPEAQRVPASRMDDLRTPLRFLLGHTELQRELTNISVVQDGSLLRIGGEPKNGGRVRHIVLKVTPLGEIVAMSVTDPDGVETSFDLTGTEENVPARDSDFRFQPPAGVTVVDGAPPL